MLHAYLFTGPQFLMDWYKYILPDKLEGLVDKLKEEQRNIITYEEMRGLSNVYKVMDLSDIAYSIKHKTKLDAAKVAKTAAIKLMEKKQTNQPALRRYGLAFMLTDLFEQSEYVKKQCIEKVLEEYETYSASTLLDKELFRYDCFYTEICNSHAFSDVAKSATEDDVQEVIEAVDAGK